MANEEQKDFNAMLHEEKGMPKMQIVTDKKTIQRLRRRKNVFRSTTCL
ncbi:hypothetical protein [Enterococcus devriesei]